MVVSCIIGRISGVDPNRTVWAIRRVILSIGGERLDTRNPTSKLMLTVLAGVATWEREIMLERQREGIAKAKTAGKYKVTPPGERRNAFPEPVGPMTALFRSIYSPSA